MATRSDDSSRVKAEPRVLRAEIRAAGGLRMAAVTLAWMLAASGASAEALLSQEQALAAAFPGATIQRVSVVLTDEQEARVKALAGSAPTSRLLAWYRATKDGHVLGAAWFDSHLVRTLPEALMIAISPEGAVLRVEILAFREPKEYMASQRWLGQFTGRKLDPELALKKGVRGISGATLTSRATTEAVRRCLALREVLGVDVHAPEPLSRAEDVAKP